MYSMTEQFIKKNLKLSLEFDKYIIQHPKTFKDIPKDAYVIVTLKNDSAFSRQSRTLIRDSKRKTVVEAQKSSSGWTIKPFQPVAA